MADSDITECLRRIVESQARLADLIEARIAPALDRIAEGLARLPAPGTGAGTVPADDPRAEALADARRAIRAGNWAEAAALAGDFAIRYPDAPESEALDAAIRAGREESARSLRGELDAASQAGDADRVVELRGALGTLLDPEALGELDRLVIGRLMGLIQKRLLLRPMPADVPALAARVAEGFAATPEGASLRRALPTLRRSAGLCPRCARPYRGTLDACPECLAPPPASAPPAAPAPTA